MVLKDEEEAEDEGLLDAEMEGEGARVLVASPKTDEESDEVQPEWASAAAWRDISWEATARSLSNFDPFPVDDVCREAVVVVCDSEVTAEGMVFLLVALLLLFGKGVAVDGRDFFLSSVVLLVAGELDATGSTDISFDPSLILILPSDSEDVSGPDDLDDRVFLLALRVVVADESREGDLFLRLLLAATTASAGLLGEFLAG